ncbi:MAG: hypothetical protein K8F90_12990 [Hyphomicrobiales bacterium]|nr:hypothetical protein [Hyphomicrobiales bacterium]
MENNNKIDVKVGASTSEPVGTGAHLFAPWMTVQEAVAYCVSKGLPRTAKTVRKWAQRSIEAAPGTGDVAVQRQDTENGFRWLIGRDSLNVKIEQEKQFEVRTDDESTGAHTFEQVATSAHLFAPVHVIREGDLGSQQDDANTSEPVQTGAKHSDKNHHDKTKNDPEIVDFLKRQLERTEKQLDVKDRQIEALLERDRETNVLIQGLQASLTGVVNALPTPRGGASQREHYQSHPHDSGQQTRDA